MFRIIAFFAVFVAVSYRASAGETSELPTRQTLIAAAAQTQRRLKTTPISWTANVGAGTRVIQLDFLQTPTKRLIVASAKGDNGARVELERLIERDDLWYVREQGSKPGKYRPGEYPFLLASFPIFRNRGDIRRVSTQLDTSTFEKVDGGAALFRVPVDEKTRAMIQGMISQIDAAAKQEPEVLQNKETASSYGRLKDILERGSQIAVDVQSGVLTHFGQGTPLECNITQMKWLDRVDESAFATDAITWEDHSSDPTAAAPADRQDWVMIGHTLAVDADGKGDLDCRLLDLKTGRMRRIPFDGDEAMPGCFLPGRDKVIVSGLTDGAMGLYEIDLKTRRNRQLGEKVLAGKFAIGPAVSPDGKTLAIAAMSLGAGLSATQVYLIDIASGAGRPLGKPFDTAFVSWMLDGKALVLVSRSSVGLMRSPKTTICRLALDGTLATIRDGDSPQVLADGRILFQEFSEDGKSWNWKTCKSDGSDVTLLADGLNRYSFPAIAPDGKRLMMIRYIPNRGTTPFVFNLGETPKAPATHLGGAWMSPRWQ